jgi:integrase
MATLPDRPSFESPHSYGSILWREHRSSYEIRFRERAGGVQRSRYIRGARDAATYRLAELELSSWITASERGVRSTDRRLTVGRYLDEWIELKRPELKPSTAVAYESRIRLYLKPVLGRHRLAELTRDDVTRAMIRLGGMRGDRAETISAGTVDAAYRVLNAALADAFDSDKAPRNACRGAAHARPSTVVEPPTQAELDRLFAALADDPWRPIFEIMRWTGARVGEVLGLTWRNVPNLEDGELRLVKQTSGTLKTRRSVRSVFVPPHVVAMIRAIPRRIDSDLVFCTSTGRPIDERNLLRVFDLALAESGIAPHADADLRKYRPHDLRHAFATMLLEAGVQPAVVIRWTGHTALAMLDRYAHVSPMPGGDAYRRLVTTYGPELAPGFGLRLDTQSDTQARI